MGLKEVINEEKKDLVNVKRPYETAAFLIFSVFFVQQIFYLLLRFIQYFKDVKTMNDAVALGATAWKVAFRYTSVTNLPIFVGRIIGVDPTSWFYVGLSFIFLILWYFLIYILVWNYCKKRNLAKWTWTTLILFGPAAIFLVPTYLWFAIYVFRPYVFRFVRRGVDEYHKYSENHVFEEEVEEEAPVLAETRKQKSQEKAQKDETIVEKEEPNKDLQE